MSFHFYNPLLFHYFLLSSWSLTMCCTYAFHFCKLYEHHASRHQVLGAQDQIIIQCRRPTCVCRADQICPACEGEHRGSAPLPLVCGLHAHLERNTISWYWQSPAYKKICSLSPQAQAENVSNVHIILLLSFPSVVYLLRSIWVEMLALNIKEILCV